MKVGTRKIHYCSLFSGAWSKLKLFIADQVSRNFNKSILRDIFVFTLCLRSFIVLERDVGTGNGELEGNVAGYAVK